LQLGQRISPNAQAAGSKNHYHDPTPNVIGNPGDRAEHKEQVTIAPAVKRWK
jgi:hypothetical protein